MVTCKVRELSEARVNMILGYSEPREQILEMVFG